MAAIAAAHNIPYVATACSSYPFDLMEKVEKAKSIHGPSYIHILSICPTDGGFPRTWPSATAGWPWKRACSHCMKWRTENTDDHRFPKLRPIQDYLQGKAGSAT